MEVKKDLGGQPTKYKPEYCQKIIDFMKDGASLTAFAGEIKVHRDTVYEWIKVHPEFAESAQVAKQLCQAWWEKVGREGLFMGKEDGTFSQSAWIFNMKARFGYRDKIEVEQKTEQKITLSYSLDDKPED